MYPQPQKKYRKKGKEANFLGIYPDLLFALKKDYYL